MILNENSWHVRCYRWGMSNRELPNDLCTYFWHHVTLFLIRVGLLTVLLCLITVFTVQAYRTPLATLVAMVMIAGGSGIIVLIILWRDRIRKESALAALIHGWKNKYCPRIEWQQKPED